MVLVGTKENGEFFRAITVDEDDIELQKVVMKNDANENLTFIIMENEEFENWLMTQ